MSLAATLLTGLAAALPSTVSAQSVTDRPLQRPAPPSWSPGSPAYSVDQFRGDPLYRVRALIEQGEFQKARMALDGNRSKSRSSESEYLLGVVSSNLGNRAASEAFRSSLSLDKHHIGATLGIALTDLRLGRRESAEAIASSLDARRASCAAGCPDAAALDRASQVLRHFLKQA